MAKYELPIYGEEDEIKTTYQTDIIRFGILEDALKISEETEGKGPKEQLQAIEPILQRVFKGLTSEDLKDADLFDVFNVFNQIIYLANGINPNNEKN